MGFSGLLIRLQRVHVEAHPDVPRTYTVSYRKQRLGEIAFSSYEAQYAGRGWRIVGPSNLALERYRFRWQAAHRLLQESLRSRTGDRPDPFLA